MLENNLKINYRKIFNKGSIEVKITFTNRCSAKCITCLNHTIDNYCDLKPEVFKKLINELLELNIPKLNLVSFYSIGESYLHPNYLELCEWAIPKLKEKGIRTGIVTNASQAYKIPDGIDYYYISFNAGTKDSYENITNLKFDTVYKNIWNLYNSGEYKKAKDFQIHMLCFDLNRGEEPEFKKLFYGMKDVKLRFSYKYDNQFGKTECGTLIDKSGRVPCDYLTNKIIVYPNGDIVLCCHDFKGTIVFGNIENESLLNILTSEKRLGLIKDHNNLKFSGLCEKCDYNTKSFEQEPFIVRWADPEQEIIKLHQQLAKKQNKIKKWYKIIKKFLRKR